MLGLGGIEVLASVQAGLFFTSISEPAQFSNKMHQISKKISLNSKIFYC
jgi:hypothetical protein